MTKDIRQDDKWLSSGFQVAALLPFLINSSIARFLSVYVEEEMLY
jgi:hypothetical protein